MVEVVVALCNEITKTYDAIGFFMPTWQTKTGLKTGYLDIDDLMGMPIQNQLWFDIIAAHIRALIIADGGAPDRTRAYVSGFLKDASSAYGLNQWDEDSLTAAVGLGVLTQKNFPRHTIFDALYATRLQKFIDKLQFARVLPVLMVNNTIPSDGYIYTPYPGPPHSPPGAPGGWNNANGCWTSMVAQSSILAIATSGYLFAFHSEDEDGVPLAGSDRYFSRALFSAEGIQATMNTRSGTGFKGNFVKNVLVTASTSLTAELTVNIGGNGVTVSGTTVNDRFPDLLYFDGFFPMNGIKNVSNSYSAGSPPFTGRWGSFFRPEPSIVDAQCGQFAAWPVIAPNFADNGSGIEGADADLSYCILDVTA